MARATKKHPGRKRRVGGWVLVALAMVVAGVWVASGWIVPGYIAPKWILYLAEGVVQWELAPELGTPGWSIQSADSSSRLQWKVVPLLPESWNAGVATYTSITYTTGGTTVIAAALCLWPIPLLLTAAGVPLLSGVRARRRARMGVCAACGYDKRGLAVGAVCPECGKS